MKKDVFITFFLTFTSLIRSLNSLPQGIVSQPMVTQEYGAGDSFASVTTEIPQVLKGISLEHMREGSTTQSDLSPNEEIRISSTTIQEDIITTSTTPTSSTTSTTKPVTTPASTTSTSEPVTTAAPTTTYAPTTHGPSTSSTTQKPNDEPCKKFDGPSFVGGVVLTMGLLAIAFVAYKFYKARNERNYHTL